jgi:solute carrier family 10 (sodium/bile acid cotransporter), member 7
MGIAMFLHRQMLPVGLLTVAIVGLIWPAPGRAMALLPTQYVAVSIIFLCSGLLLRTQEIRHAASAWPATLWGMTSILFITPAVGVAVALHAPLEDSFRLGLAIFCCMPTTLSSGIALTSQAKGNTALALLLTVSTNLLGVFTIPFVLAIALGAVGSITLSAESLLVKLCLTILLPLIAGRLLRLRLGDWADARRSNITVVSNLALISVPWMKFSQSSDRLAAVAPDQLLMLVGAGLVIHVLYLALNGGATRLFGFSVPVRKAVVMMASQKTLPVALTVLALIPDEVLSAQSKGLVVIPCITSHLGQIFVDAFLATRWSTMDHESDGRT